MAAKSLLQKGNKSAMMAAIGNGILFIIKGTAAFFSGSGAMFAEAMHSLADTANQTFVFFGSILSEKEATEKYPYGFARVINLFCMVAVTVVTILAYETIKHGIALIKHPHETSNFWLNLFVLLIALVLDGGVWIKAMKEIVHETRGTATGLALPVYAFKKVGLASPSTKLVFYEDFVATIGIFVALGAIITAEFTGLYIFDGFGAVFIGLLLLVVAFKVGFDNMQGLIGVASPIEIENCIAKAILSTDKVVDIKTLLVTQEGRYIKVEGQIELARGLTLADADDIKMVAKSNIWKKLPEVRHITLGIYEDAGIQEWEF